MGLETATCANAEMAHPHGAKHSSEFFLKGPEFEGARTLAFHWARDPYQTLSHVTFPSGSILLCDASCAQMIDDD